MFTASHLETLRNEYAKIDRVDPSFEAYDKMKKLLDAMTDDQLSQVRRADIKFLSSLATNRCVRRGLA